MLQSKTSLFLVISTLLVYSTFVLSSEKIFLKGDTIRSLELKGFKVNKEIEMFKTQAIKNDTLIETEQDDFIKISVSKKINDVGEKAIRPKDLSLRKSFSTQSMNSTVIMTEDFESGVIDSNKWILTGNPTWGITDYKKKGNFSTWCAAGGDSAIEPGKGYPRNLKAEMIFGPFDLSDVNYGEFFLSYMIDIEYEKDWFFYMISDDGVNFSGTGVSGTTGQYTSLWFEDDFIPLNNVWDLGDVTGKDRVWIALLCVSDSLFNDDLGVFVDDISITKSNLDGTPLSGYISGILSKQYNPYIIPNTITVNYYDSLIIEPGTQLFFEEGVEFEAIGILKAIGTPSDTILFTSNAEAPDLGDWTGIGFYSINPDTLAGSIIQYAKIEYAGNNSPNRSGGMEGGIFYASKHPIISNCLIKNNSNYGIFSTSSPEISGNKIIYNQGGIRAYSCSPQIINNDISNNTGEGINLFLSDSHIKDNIIKNNQSTGIGCCTSDPVIVRNQICNNGGNGVYGGCAVYEMNSSLTLVNNKIQNNEESGVKLSVYCHTGKLIGNIISGNKIDGVDVYQITYGEPYLTLSNNTIVDNLGCGINYSARTISNSTIQNNIIANNQKDGIKCNFAKSYNIWYNNIYNNNPNFKNFSDSLGIGTNYNDNGHPCDPYFNIILDPNFDQKYPNEYNLTQSSPCVDAGNPSTFYNDINGTINDMGATGGNGLNTSFPLEVDFGFVLNHMSRSRRVYIYNFTDSTFGIDETTLSNVADFKILKQPTNILPFENDYIELSFSPQDTGYFNAELNIKSNDLYGTNQEIFQLVGTSINGTLINGGSGDFATNYFGTMKKENSPYIIIGSIHVPLGKSLIVEPGVHVYVEKINTSYHKEKGRIGIYGTIYAVGTKDEPIIFTSLHRNAIWGGIALASANDTSRIENCIISNSNEFGLSLYDSDIIVKNCIIKNNKGDYGIYDGVNAGGIYCSSSNAIITNNIITENYTTKSGGGIYCCGTASPIISNNIISYNIAETYGGGLAAVKDSAIICNNIFIGNSSCYGGGIYCESHWRPLVNNTIVKNKAVVSNSSSGSGGGAYLGRWGSMLIINSIVYSNSPDQMGRTFYGGRPNVAYSNIEGNYNGMGNIDFDPLFIDALNQNYHMQTSSPCVDAGSDSLIYNDPKDPDNPGYALYPALGTVRNDMGAYGGPGSANWVSNFLNAPPSAFNLIYPINKQKIPTKEVILKWEKAVDRDNDPIEYTVYYSNDKSFSQVNQIEHIKVTSAKIQNLLNKKAYYWKVKASDSNGGEVFSNHIFHFIPYEGLPIFSPVMPVDGDTVTTESVHFTWEHNVDAASYQFLIDTTKSLSNAIILKDIYEESMVLKDSLTSEKKYYWTILAEEKEGYFTACCDTFSFLYQGNASGLKNRLQLPTIFALHQNYPNPFNPITTIKYQLPKSSHVSIKIFNSIGQEVRTLVDEEKKAGYYTIHWDASNNATGLYFVTMKTEEYSENQKMLLIR